MTENDSLQIDQTINVIWLHAGVSCRNGSSMPVLAWTVQERISSDGAGSRSYYYRGQLAIRVELSSKPSRQLGGFILIEKDVRTIKSWLVALRDLTEAVGAVPVGVATFMPKDERMSVVRGLFVAVVTTYGKMFTQADGRGASLHRNGWVDSTHLETHDWLMHQRHTFAAHSGVDGLEGCKIVLAIDYSRKNRTAPRLFSELHQPAAMDLDSLDKLSALLDALQLRLAERIEKSLEFVRAEELQRLTEKQLKILRKGATGRLLRRK